MSSGFSERVVCRNFIIFSIYYSCRRNVDAIFWPIIYFFRGNIFTWNPETCNETQNFVSNSPTEPLCLFSRRYFPLPRKILGMYYSKRYVLVHLLKWYSELHNISVCNVMFCDGTPVPFQNLVLGLCYRSWKNYLKYWDLISIIVK